MKPIQVLNEIFGARIFLCLVTLELWLPDNNSFVVFLLRQKTNLIIFQRNCFTLVLWILITIIPACFWTGTKISIFWGPDIKKSLDIAYCYFLSPDSFATSHFSIVDSSCRYAAQRAPFCAFSDYYCTAPTILYTILYFIQYTSISEKVYL